MGLKHGKYIYVKRNDGYYVKVRVLNIRFKGKTEGADINNPSKYIATNYKTTKPPLTATIISEEVLPEDIRKIINSI